ncbi:MAG: thiamine pyrophosphate-binding protein [Candidatus Methanomethylophilaceae archaeon]
MTRAADVLARTLASQGVRTVHGIPGGETVHVMDSILQSGLEFICVRDENAAAFMAMGASRMNGSPGVCLTTVGPGASNIFLGTATANLDHIPLLVLTGDFEKRVRGEPHRQGFDQQTAFSVFTKYSRRIERPEDTERVLRQALMDCLSEPPGPVHIALPMDIMGGTAGEQTPFQPDSKGHVVADIQPLRQALLRSQRPFIICGHGVIRAGAADDLRSMAKAWNVPVTHSWMGDGVLPWDDPLGLHRIGLPQNHILPALGEADLMLCVGLDVEELHPGIWEALAHVPAIHLSQRPQPLSPRHPRQSVAIGDLAPSLRSLSEYASPRPSWTTEMKASLQRHLNAPASSGRGGLHPVDLVRILRAHMRREDVVVSDVGAHMLWLCELYPSYRENTLLVSNGMIPMGIGLPAALGVKKSCPERRVVNLCGDGGFQMSLAELGTAVQNHLPVVSVVWNDSCLGLIRTRHEMAYGRHCGTDLHSPDFSLVAKAYGAEGYRVDSVEGLDEALGLAVRSSLPSVIDVRVDNADNSLLFRPPDSYKS